MPQHKDLTGADLHVNLLHSDTHGAAGTDPLVLAESQVTALTTDLAAKVVGPISAVAGHLAIFADINGKAIEDGGATGLPDVIDLGSFV